MCIGLVESPRRRERSESGMAVSVAVHAAVIGLAWFATAGATGVLVRPLAVTVLPIYHDPSHQNTTSTSTHGGGPSQHVLVDRRIPSKIPPVKFGPIITEEPAESWDSLVAGPNDMGASHGTGTSAAPAPDAGVVFTTVDVTAEPDPRNPAPAYPEMLRSAGVQGSVSAQIVVDTSGRVIASTIAFVGGDNALFQQSVRRALEGGPLQARAGQRPRGARPHGAAVRVPPRALIAGRLGPGC